MIKKSLLAFAAIALLAGCKPQKVSDEQIKQAVASYIKENPQEVLAAIRSAAQGQAGGRPGAGQPPAENPGAVKEAIKKALPKLLDASHHATIGDKNSKNIVVEFYDYNCGFCKKALDTVNKLANEDKARVILVELPVLGPTSEEAAIASAVVNSLAPSKFHDFHSALLTGEGRVDQAKIEASVQAVGIDLAKFKEEITKEKYTKIINENREIASSLGIRGTPSFIVNDTVIRGAQPYDNFKAALKK